MRRELREEEDNFPPSAERTRGILSKLAKQLLNQTWSRFEKNRQGNEKSTNLHCAKKGKKWSKFMHIFCQKPLQVVMRSNRPNSLYPTRKVLVPTSHSQIFKMVCPLGRSWLANSVTGYWTSFCAPELTLDLVSTRHHASGRTPLKGLMPKRSSNTSWVPLL